MKRVSYKLFDINQITTYRPAHLIMRTITINSIQVLKREKPENNDYFRVLRLIKNDTF